MKSLFNCTQKEDEDIKTHHDRFTQKVEVLNDCGTDTGAITGEHQRDFETATPEMSEEDEIKKADSDVAIEKDEELITKLKTQEAEKFLAHGSLANCDKKNHGDSVEDLNNACTLAQ